MRIENSMKSAKLILLTRAFNYVFKYVSIQTCIQISYERVIVSSAF